MKEIKGKVIKFYNIPKEVLKNHWLGDYGGMGSETFVQCHIDMEDKEIDKLQDWLLEEYPELEHEEYFFIQID